MGLGEPLFTNSALHPPPHLPLPFATALMSEYLSFMSSVSSIGSMAAWDFASLAAAAAAGASSSSLDTVDGGILMSSCSSYCDSFVLDCGMQVGNGSEGRCGGGSGGGGECGGGSGGEVGLGYSCDNFMGGRGGGGDDDGDDDRFKEGEGEGDGGGGGEAVFVGEFTGW